MRQETPYFPQILVTRNAHSLDWLSRNKWQAECYVIPDFRYVVEWASTKERAVAKVTRAARLHQAKYEREIVTVEL